MKFLFKNISQDPISYVLLALFFLVCLLIFIFAGGDPHTHRNIVYIATAGYFGWSLMHHYRRGDLSLAIVVEYLLMGLLAIIVLTSTFFLL